MAVKDPFNLTAAETLAVKVQDAIREDDQVKLQALMREHPRAAGIYDADPTTGVTNLHEAAAENASEIIDFLVHNGFDVDVLTKTGDTPLSYAFDAKQEQALVKLLKLGANPNRLLQGKRSLLGEACTHKNPRAVQQLLKFQADPNFADGVGRTPMHYMAQQPFDNRENLQIVYLLLRAGADVEIQDQNGLRPLDLARQLQAPGPAMLGFEALMLTANLGKDQPEESPSPSL